MSCQVKVNEEVGRMIANRADSDAEKRERTRTAMVQREGPSMQQDTQSGRDETDRYLPAIRFRSDNYLTVRMCHQRPVTANDFCGMTLPRLDSSVFGGDIAAKDPGEVPSNLPSR